MHLTKKPFACTLPSGRGNCSTRNNLVETDDASAPNARRSVAALDGRHLSGEAFPQALSQSISAAAWGT
jgi:hypothetical protein